MDVIFEEMKGKLHIMRKTKTFGVQHYFSLCCIIENKPPGVSTRLRVVAGLLLSALLLDLRNLGLLLFLHYKYISFI